MNKRQRGGSCAMKIDEMVIASCLLMVALQGCQRMACPKLFPLHLFLLCLLLPLMFTFQDNCKCSIE